MSEDDDGGASEPRHVETLTGWFVRREHGDSGAQFRRRAMTIAAAEVIETDADKKHTLIKIAYRISFIAPQVFQGFMAVPVVAVVKLRDAPDKRRGSPFAAAFATPWGLSRNDWTSRPGAYSVLWAGHRLLFAFMWSTMIVEYGRGASPRCDRHFYHRLRVQDDRS